MQSLRVCCISARVLLQVVELLGPEIAIYRADNGVGTVKSKVRFRPWSATCRPTVLPDVVILYLTLAQQGYHYTVFGALASNQKQVYR